jgi:hypothetical protein
VSLPELFDGTDEDQKERGLIAEGILGNHVFLMAERDARDEIRESWAAEEDPAKREQLWHSARALDVLRRKLEEIKTNGEHSGHRVDEFAAIK